MSKLESAAFGRATAAIAAVWTGFAAFAGPFDSALLRGRTLEDRFIYEPSEKMSFELTLTGAEAMPEGEYTIKWERTGDDGKSVKGEEPAVNGKSFVIETSLVEPGFVRIYAELVGKDGKPYKKDPKKFQGDAGKIFFDGGAGVQPERLKGVPEPKDFDEFWARQKRRLAAMPMESQRKALASKKGKVYAVEVNSPSVRPVTGYLSIPEGAKEGKKYPCLLVLWGYGYNNPHYKAPESAEDDKIIFNINAHGMRLPAFGADEAYIRALGWEIQSNGKGYAFDPEQNKDPELAYFNGMAIRVMRALQYLKSLPEWNGKDLIAAGTSQGGLQTIWAAALDPQVTRAESTVTWCCDMGGTEYGRNRGNWYIHWVPALGYYDPINMARRIPKTCTTIIPRAGLGDYVCPPSGLAILFYNIPGPKKITWVQGSTHGYTPPGDNQTYTWATNGAE